MRELSEARAHRNAPASAVPPPRAAGASGCQVAQDGPGTRCFYGYRIGEEPDPLLCGHPDLRY